MKKYIANIFKICVVAIVLFGASRAEALTVSPLTKEIGGDPGSTIQGTIKIYNETRQDVTVAVSASNFKAKENGTGEPEFASSNDPATDLASWIKVPTGPITLKPLAWQDVAFEVDIPKDADPGGHYAAVLFSANSQGTENGNVSLGSKTGTLILLGVSGKTDQTGKIKDLALQNGRWVYDSLPVDLDAYVENDGNLHFKPNGSLEIRNIFGMKIAELPLLDTNEGGNVLPGSTRKYDVLWGDEKNTAPGFWNKVAYEWRDFHIGRYEAVSQINLPQGRGQSVSVAFWVFPWQLILVIIIFLGIVWLAYQIVRYRTTKYERNEKSGLTHLPQKS